MKRKAAGWPSVGALVGLFVGDGIRYHREWSGGPAQARKREISATERTRT